VKVLSTRATPAREDRPATQLLYDEGDVRVVSFHLLAGQEVPPHRSTSTVVVQVTDGQGYFAGDDGETFLDAGDVAVFAPEEKHSIRATDRPLRFVAILSPRPT
jgi:quercetin dioxygenase-like cupin family protein